MTGGGLDDELKRRAKLRDGEKEEEKFYPLVIQGDLSCTAVNKVTESGFSQLPDGGLLLLLDLRTLAGSPARKEKVLVNDRQELSLFNW